MGPDRSRRSPFALASLVALVALVAAVAPWGACVAADELPTVVARRSGDALIVLNASALVASLTAADAAAAEADAQLERRAVRAVASKLALVRDSRSITVRIVYDRTAAVSSAYGELQSQRVERYADVAMATVDATGDRDHWKEAAASDAPLPAWIRMTVVGELPPPR